MSMKALTMKPCLTQISCPLRLAVQGVTMILIELGILVIPFILFEALSLSFLDRDWPPVELRYMC